MDPISDMFNRIRNAQTVSHQTVYIPFSKLKNEIVKILEEKGFIGKAEKTMGKNNLPSKKKFLKITLKYNDNIPAISSIKMVSKPGQRIYVKYKDIRLIRDRYGVNIISTPKGLMTGREAKKQKLGGEVIAEIW